jgi:hypothetical protein
LGECGKRPELHPHNHFKVMHAARLQLHCITHAECVHAMFTPPTINANKLRTAQSNSGLRKSRFIACMTLKW